MLKRVVIEITAVCADILDFLNQAWWVEISTVQPQCLYYFGPFTNAIEAKVATLGYIEDLEGESAQGIKTQIKRGKHYRLTIDCGDW
jgi:hypothetical protein